MIVSLYSPATTRQLAASVVTSARAAVTKLSDPHPVALGGGWQQGTWREDLRRAGTHGQPVAALALRGAPTDRVLTDRDWADITRGLAEHSGLSGTPWVAVRTGLRAALLLARTDQRPAGASLRDFVADVERTYGLTPATRPGGRAAPDQPAPMQAFPTLAPTVAGAAPTATAAAAAPTRHAGRSR